MKGFREVNLQTVEVEGIGNRVIELGKYIVRGESDQMIDAGKYFVYWRNVKDGDGIEVSTTPASILDHHSKYQTTSLHLRVRLNRAEAQAICKKVVETTARG